MFYSHEILTDRKHGVATIWLVATLGSRSNLKKVTRKAILDVEIPKACETITDNERPMALRLQGSLLYGVSRVFSQQCGYVLTDAQNLSGKMRGVTLMMKRDGNIDQDVAVLNPLQLNIQDDPAFNIDYDMGFDLSAFDYPTDTSGMSSLLSPNTLRSSQSSLMVEEDLDEPGLILPSLDTPGVGFLGSGFGGISSSQALRSGDFQIGSVMDEQAVFNDSAFVMGDNGELLTGDEVGGVGLEQIIPSIGAYDIDMGEVQTRDEDRPVLSTENPLDLGIDDGGPMPMADDGDDFPFPAEIPPVATFTAADRSSIIAEEVHSPLAMNEQAQDTNTTTEAPQQQGRSQKPLELDTRAELSNGKLSAWSREYLQNMKDARVEKANRQAAAQGRRNAQFWVLNQGIGGVMVNYSGEKVPHPFAAFSGQALIDALTGRESSPSSKKRGRSPSDHKEQEDGDRNVRARSEEDQFGRDNGGEIQGFGDDPILYDEDVIDSEVGRQAPSSQDMPWNISSRPGSVRPYGSGFGRSSSIRGLATMNVGLLGSDQANRRSRLTSASPLLNKGTSLPRLGSRDSQDPGLTAFETDDIGDFDMGISNDLGGDFELYGPAAAVSTQTAAQNSWLATTLENEAQNFLTFLANCIENRELDDEGGMGEANATAIFAHMLPPETNSKIVGAQGLLHVLSLATKGVIKVQQDSAFDSDIVLGIIEDAGTHQPVEAGDD